MSAATTVTALAWTAHELGDVGVGGVAEEHPPRLAVLLDEAEERVDAAAQALVAVARSCAARCRRAKSSVACSASSAACSSRLDAKCS